MPRKRKAVAAKPIDYVDPRDWQAILGREHLRLVRCSRLERARDRDGGWYLSVIADVRAWPTAKEIIWRHAVSYSPDRSAWWIDRDKDLEAIASELSCVRRRLDIVMTLRLPASA
jgi:hypothetical protein